jgi:hypothetical protein
MSDAVFFILAIVLGLLSLWLFYFSLFRDRSRGRRRCPKCWYDMRGTQTLKCSECGHIGKKEKRLFKTRRRWRVAFVALVLLIAGWASLMTPGIQKRGWIAQLPTSALIILSPAPKDQAQTVSVGSQFMPMRLTVGPTWRDQVFAELVQRVNEEKLWSWQWRWMIRKHWDDSNPPWTFKMVTRSAWPTEGPAYACPVISRSDGSYISLSNRLLRFRISGGKPHHERAFEVYALIGKLSQPTDPWLETAFACNKDNTEFLLAVDRQTRAGKWQCVWKSQVGVQIVRDDALTPLIPDASNALTRQIREAMTFKVERDALHVRWSNVQDAELLPTLALDFELLRDGELMARASAWWTSEINVPAGNVGPRAIPFHYRVLWDKPIAAEAIESAPDGAWELHITGSEKLALRDVESSDYWAGSITVPLHWEMANRNWINASSRTE